MRRRGLAPALVGLLVAACGQPVEQRRPADLPDDGIVTAATVTEPADRVGTAAPQEPPTIGVLVFTRTAGFRHDVLDGVAPDALRELAAASRVPATVTFTDDPAVFTDAGLAPYSAVVFLATTGDVLGAAGQHAFERYVEAGGGFAGVHSAADTEYDWPWYGELVGAYFATHPAPSTAVVVVEDAAHPSTAHLPSRWSRADEWYSFRTNPRDGVHVLASLDESTYSPGDGAMGDHPIVWCHTVGAGRSWYTALGHTAESYADPAFREHLWNGILSVTGATGVAAGAC